MARRFAFHYTWDADGNSITVDTVGATFDALDRMVEQNRSSVYTEIVYSPTGAKLALMSGTAGQTLQNAFIPLPGQATAVYTSAGLDHYRHSDWLGSARATSSPSRTVVSTTAYAPFGEIYAQSGTTDASFTGQNMDTVSDPLSGDYDFLYREYNTQGRWPSPDKAGLAAANTGNPQSWNRYAYVMNNPLVLVDPTGLDSCWSHSSYEGSGSPPPCSWGGGAGASCMMDGAPMDCGTVAGAINMGGAAICPNNDCYNQTLTVNNYGGTVFISTFSSVWAAGLDFSGGCVGTNCALAVNLSGTPAYPNDGSILSRIMNDPSMASNWTSTFNSASDWVTAGAIYTGVGLTSVAGTAAISSLSWGELAVGRTADGALHFAFGQGGEWAHYVTAEYSGEAMQLSTRFAAQFASNAWFTVPVPVLNPAVIYTAAATASNCFTGACSALWGW